MTLSAFAVDSQVDLRIDTNPYNLEEKSSFNVTTTTAMVSESEKHALIFTPEMSFYANGGIDFSITYGHRHRLSNFVVGHHFFFDRTNVSFKSLDQIGSGIDIQTNLCDFRMNYYHPTTKYGKGSIRACKWADCEIFFKTPYFGVGTGPLYNLDMKAWALHSRIVIPLKSCSLNFGAICGGGEYGQSQAVFSLSFHLFEPNKRDALISPPCHVQKSNIYYNSGYALDKPNFKQRRHGIVKLDYNPSIVSYIAQTEDDVTLRDKEHKEHKDGNKEEK